MPTKGFSGKKPCFLFLYFFRRIEPVLFGAGPDFPTRASQRLHLCRDCRDEKLGTGETPKLRKGRTFKVKRGVNKHLNAGNQILWLVQKTLMKNEVNVGNAIIASAHNARLYN